MRRGLPTPKFLRDMGVASIIAGVVMLGASHLMKLAKRLS